MSEVKQLIDEKIQSKKVMVFSKTRCSYCRKAIDLLKSYSLLEKDMEVMQIENESNCAEIQAYLKTITGASSVPRIFINGKSIGGCDDIVKLHNQDELKKLLEN